MDIYFQFTLWIYDYIDYIDYLNNIHIKLLPQLSFDCTFEMQFS